MKFKYGYKPCALLRYHPARQSPSVLPPKRCTRLSDRELTLTFVKLRYLYLARLGDRMWDTSGVGSYLACETDKSHLPLNSVFFSVFDWVSCVGLSSSPNHTNSSSCADTFRDVWKKILPWYWNAWRLRSPLCLAELIKRIQLESPGSEPSMQWWGSPFFLTWKETAGVRTLSDRV